MLKTWGELFVGDTFWHRGPTYWKHAERAIKVCETLGQLKTVLKMVQDTFGQFESSGVDLK